MSAPVTRPPARAEPHSSQAYERLRRQALSRPERNADRRGLAALERQGVAGWLATLAPLPPATAVAETPPDSERGQRADMVGILVAMVCAHLTAKQEQTDA
ncbi:MAG: hypothetical protein OXN89_16780 [Bryobacterales bacterium]|nr:hypothetical protein [Bryobacterales bacterium]